MTAQNRKEAQKQARSVVNKWALGLATIAWIPGSQYVTTGGDVAMVIKVAAIYGIELDKAGAGVVFTTVAAPLIASKAANSALDFVPVVGWAAKSAVAAGVTKAVGEALIAYFEEESSLPEKG